VTARRKGSCMPQTIDDFRRGIGELQEELEVEFKQTETQACITPVDFENRDYVDSKNKGE